MHPIAAGDTDGCRIARTHGCCGAVVECDIAGLRQHRFEICRVAAVLVIGHVPSDGECTGPRLVDINIPVAGTSVPIAPCRGDGWPAIDASN